MHSKHLLSKISQTEHREQTFFDYALGYEKARKIWLKEREQEKINSEKKIEIEKQKEAQEKNILKQMIENSKEIFANRCLDRQSAREEIIRDTIR